MDALKLIPSEYYTVGNTSVSLVVIGLAGWLLFRRPASQLPLPPGPKGLPLIGNMLDIPREKEQRAYHRLSEKYGEVAHLEVFGSHVIVLGSAESVKDLLERRSSNYSDRPFFTMATELAGYGEWSIPTRAYGDAWRRDRRVLHSEMREGAVEKYQGILARHTHTFLKELVEDPDNFVSISRGYLGSAMMDMVYGVQDSVVRDQYVAVAEEVNKRFASLALPGAYLVDVIPALKYLPRWFPGTGFHKIAEASRQVSYELLENPMKVIRGAMASGEAIPCMVTRMLDFIKTDTGLDIDEESVRNAAATAYGGGADTMVSSIITFFLAMTRYPAIQKQAQEELDLIIGRDRLPNFSDRTALPYINALLSEILRWIPSIPIVPHCSMANDEYKGYFIPKGSVVIANIWALLHDPQDYPDPEEFRPDRFLRKTNDGRIELDDCVPDPRLVAFGFSRRKCPGRVMAEQILFGLITAILATCSITPKVDDAGEPLYPPVEVTSGLSCRSLPFECNIKVRSLRASELLQGPIGERGL